MGLYRCGGGNVDVNVVTTYSPSGSSKFTHTFDEDGLYIVSAVCASSSTTYSISTTGTIVGQYNMRSPAENSVYAHSQNYIIQAKAGDTTESSSARKYVAIIYKVG